MNGATSSPTGSGTTMHLKVEEDLVTPRGPGFPDRRRCRGRATARMMAQPAIALGVGLRVLAGAPWESAAQVGHPTCGLDGMTTWLR